MPVFRPRKQKRRPEGGVLHFMTETRLLDLGFLEFDMLLGDRVVLAERQLVGLGAAVLARHIEEAGVGGRKKLDLDVRGFGHDVRPLISWSSSRWDTGRKPRTRKTWPDT